MSLRIAAASFVLLAAACAAAGCSRHGTHPAPSAAASAAVPGANLANGKAVYEAQCAACHGKRGIAGPVGPSLQNENTRRPYRSVYATVLEPDPPMPKLYPSRITLSDVRDVSAYVETL